MEALGRFFDSADLLPHGLCLEWRPELIWLHAASDVLTAAAYYSIPVALLIFASRRRDLQFRWVFLLFGAFILACGTTHLTGVVTLWQPAYGAQGFVKAVTAVVSVITAAVLWPMIPRALALPGPAQWQAVNAEVRQLNVELEDRVRERTAALENTNVMLRAEIARRVEVEAELRAAKAAAEEASRSKARFFAAASHDLRQPFQAMRLFHGVLSGQASDGGQRQAMDCLGQAMSAGEALLTSLLDVARLDSGIIAVERQPVDVVALLHEVAASFQPVAAEKGLSLRVVAAPTVILADPVLLRRVLANLVSNAIRYTDRGGVLVAARKRAGGLVFEVWDTGIGIAEDAAALIFEEFYQAHNPSRDRSQGLGLGLAIVKRLCALLGYQVSLASRSGRGSVFRVTVPPVEAAASALTAP